MNDMDVCRMWEEYIETLTIESLLDSRVTLKVPVITLLSDDRRVLFFGWGGLGEIRIRIGGIEYCLDILSGHSSTVIMGDAFREEIESKVNIVEEYVRMRNL